MNGNESSEHVVAYCRTAASKKAFARVREKLREIWQEKRKIKRRAKVAGVKRKMQILSSGSFVKLEHKERIENLIFTTKEMANAAVETEGFANEPENNRRLALEIWHGAEYLTLDHEDAQVKNLFVNNFLDRLREIGGAGVRAETVLQHIASEIETPNAPSEIETPRDEFLGLVSIGEIEEKPVDETADTIESQENRAVENAVSERVDSAAVSEIDSAEIDEPANESAVTIDEAAIEEIELVEPERETIVETAETPESASSGGNLTENNSATPKVPGAIALPEKEPYRWEKCTVTATIQLLPTTDDSIETKRKAVLSVRTHDFAPQFSVAEFGDGNSILSELLPALRESLEKYKADLPLKVMDKMKREKSAAKKQPNKTTAPAKTSAANNSAVGSQPNSDKKPTEKITVKPETAKSATATTTAAPKPSAVVPSASGQQGSLFNF